MHSSFYPGCCGVTRRGFVLGAGAGLLGSGALAWLGTERLLRALELPGVGPAPAGPAPTDGMPGPYPGRVVEVHQPGSVRPDHSIDHSSVREMVQRGMRELTGADAGVEAWRRFFCKGDVVGIKVNPVGRRYSPGRPQAISSHELVLEIVLGLKSAGVQPQDIILFERYADQFRDAGYEQLLSSPPLAGVRWYAAAAQYTQSQLDIEGYDGKRDSDPHVIGYDPDVFFQAGYASNVHDPKDDRRFRSHMCVVASRLVNKIINLPVLKDHGSGGVTLALKNLSHGLNNNVARSHLGRFHLQAGASRPNQNNTFIPTAVAQAAIRQKTVLNIMDGLVAVWQGGPSSTRGAWARESLFFATDPVAMDMIGWQLVDEKRVEKGLPPVALSGSQLGTPGESLDRRQPEHIILAGTLGLGVYDPKRIDYRRLS